MNTELQEQESGPAAAEERRIFIPAVNIFEKSDHFLVTAEMPGVDEKGVDVTLERDRLTITGRCSPDVPQDAEPSYAECEPGDYRRVLQVSGDQVDRDGIEAGIRNGVLRVKLPKREAAKPRKIAVKGE